MKKELIIALLVSVGVLFAFVHPGHTQVVQQEQFETFDSVVTTTPGLSITASPSATLSASLSPSPSPTPVVIQPSIFEEKEPEQPEKDPIETDEDLQKEFQRLFQGRMVESPNLFTLMPYMVQYAVKKGLPAETITLILLLPLLATIIAFFRHVVGIPTIGLLVPIALSITLLATGITPGIVLLLTIIFATTIARILLKKVRIMQLPKVAMSMLLVSFFIFIVLMIGATTKFIAVRQLSIFPVLMLILLSERIVQIQLERTYIETVQITSITLLLAIGGFFLMSAEFLRTMVLVYPELVLLLIPANILVGRYFGLRLTEYYRFSPMRHGN